MSKLPSILPALFLALLFFFCIDGLLIHPMPVRTGHVAAVGLVLGFLIYLRTEK